MDNNHDGPLRILFNEPQKARYVMIQASGTCYLSLDEVEIYPAKKDVSGKNDSEQALLKASRQIK